MKKIKEFFINLWTNIKKKPFGFIGRTLLFILALVILICSFIPRNSKTASADIETERISFTCEDYFEEFAPKINDYFPNYIMGTKYSLENSLIYIPDTFPIYQTCDYTFHFINESISGFKCENYSNDDIDYNPSIYYYFKDVNNNYVSGSRLEVIKIVITNKFGVDDNCNYLAPKNTRRYITMCMACKTSANPGIIYNIYYCVELSNTNIEFVRSRCVYVYSYDNFRSAHSTPIFIKCNGLKSEYSDSFYYLISGSFIGSSLLIRADDAPNRYRANDYYYSQYIYEYGVNYGSQLGYNNGKEEGYNIGFNAGHTAGRNEALTEGLKNPVGFILDPVVDFLEINLFGVVSIGSILSIAIFVAVACIFLKMFAGG